MSCTKVKKGAVFHPQPARDTGQTLDFGRPQNPERSPRKGGSLFTTVTTKAKGLFKNPADAGRSKTPPRRTWSESNIPSNPSGYQSGTGIKLPPLVQDTGYQLASSSYGDRKGSREMDVYQTRAPPPGSYQDDDTGPSPKNLVMAVMGVKGAVTQFAKVLTLNMSKDPEHSKHFKRTIRQAMQAEVDRPNHFKFLVQAFVCKRMFEGFEAQNGFYGIRHFDGLNMSHVSSFADFSKFKDKAATISGLLAKDSTDLSFLGKFCFMKFTSIAGVLDTNQSALPFHEEEWSMIEREQHPRSEFYQSFLKVAVSVWLLHRLIYSFEQGWEMLGWETFLQGCKFQKNNMESVVPGGFEEENDETGTDMNTVVGFLVIPGFQVSKSVVKCEVYLRNVSSLDDGKIMDASEFPSRDQSLEKSFTDKTPANYHFTPEKRNLDSGHGSPAMGEQTGETVGNRNRRSRVAPGRSTVSKSGQLDSKVVSGRSTGSRSGHLDTSDRPGMSTHFYPVQASSKPSRPSDVPGARRHNKVSKQKEEMSRRAEWTQ